MLDAIDVDEESLSITCRDSNDPEKTKTKRLRTSENRDINTRKERKEHKKHDEKSQC